MPSRLAAALAAGLAVLAAACGSSSSPPAAAPPPQAAPAPDPQGGTTTATGQPSPSQPPPSPANPQPSPAPAPTPTPSPSPAPSPAPHAATIRWAIPSPGLFWAGMDDSGARWSAADLRAPDHAALRLEKRDRDGHLLWSGEWTYRGPYGFTAAVTPGGEPLFAAETNCEGDDPGCRWSIDVGGAPHRGSAVVKLATDGHVRWIRTLNGRLAGADAAGGAALAYSRPAGTTTMLVVKLDDGGNTVWTRQITSTLALRLDRTGAVQATGCYQGDRELLAGIPCQGGMIAARLAPDGRVEWTSHVDGYWAVIDTTADGGSYAAARGGNPAFVLTALGPDGTPRWTGQFGAGVLANQRGEPLTVAAAANGPVAVAGYTYANAAVNAVLLGWDASGNPTFTDQPGFWQPTVMVYGADGELLLVVPGGGVDAPGGHVEGPALIELTP